MEGFKGAPVQKMNCSPSRTSCHCSETGQRCYWAETSRALGLLRTTLSALSSHAAPFHCLSHLSVAHLFNEVVLQIAMCHTVHFVAQTALHTNTYAMSHWCGSMSLISEAP